MCTTKSYVRNDHLVTACTLPSSNECVPFPFLCQELCLCTTLPAVWFVTCGIYIPQEEISVFQVRWLGWAQHWSTTSYTTIIFVQVYTISLSKWDGTPECHTHICFLVPWGTLSNRAEKCKLGLMVPWINVFLNSVHNFTGPAKTSKNTLIFPMNIRLCFPPSATIMRSYQA